MDMTPEETKEAILHDFKLRPVLEGSPGSCQVCKTPDCEPVTTVVDFGSILPEDEDAWHDPDGARIQLSKLSDGVIDLNPGWGLECMTYYRIPSDDPTKESMVELYVKTLTVGWCQVLDKHWCEPEWSHPEWRWPRVDD